MKTNTILQSLFVFFFTSVLFPQQSQKINDAGKTESQSSELISVNISVEPLIEQILVDGKAHRSVEAILLKRGEHVIDIEKDGYNSIVEKFIVDPEHNSFLFRLSELEQIPIMIKSVPSGADILIDNTEMGKTDDKLLLYPGKYLLKLSKSGYDDSSQSIEIQKKGNSTFSYFLNRNASILMIQVNPEDAKITINRENYVNRKSIELSPGKYKIEIEKNGYNKLIEFIALKSNDTLIKHYTLSGKFGTLQLTVSPVDALVKISSNGMEVNRWKGAKIDKGIAIGEYDLEASSIDYNTFRKHFIITENNSTEIEIVLKPSVVKKSNEELSSMVLVIGGTFQMGNNDGANDEKPVHNVTLRSFYIDKYEVTVGEYRKFCISTGREMPLEPKWGWNENDPMTNVSWNEANEYAKWIGKRLPTEAEWEFAARGGSRSQAFIFSGGNNLEDIAWYNDNSGKNPHKIGSMLPNELGIFDMSGNVSEWCQDWYSSIYYKQSSVENPTGPEGGIFRIYRGGSWDSESSKCKVTSRNGGDPENIENLGIGFRLVYNEN